MTFLLSVATIWAVACVTPGPNTLLVMRYALTAPLTFERPDLVRFPALGLAIAALTAGGAMPAILNAANEVAVAAYLEGAIAFPGIAALVETVCAATASDASAPADVAAALAIDHEARNRARSLLSRASFAVT